MIVPFLLLLLSYHQHMVHTLFYEYYATLLTTQSVRASDKAYAEAMVRMLMDPQSYPLTLTQLRPIAPLTSMLDWRLLLASAIPCSQEASSGLANQISARSCHFTGEHLIGSNARIGNIEGSLTVGNPDIAKETDLIATGSVTIRELSVRAPTKILSLGPLHIDTIRCSERGSLMLFSFRSISYQVHAGCQRFTVVPQLQEQQALLRQYYPSRTHLTYGIVRLP
jgi:hypothetical protein